LTPKLPSRCPSPANDEEVAKPKRRRSRKTAEASEAVEAVAAVAEVAPELALEPVAEAAPEPAAEPPAPTPVADNEAEAPAGPPRRGWWQRTFGA
jgi:ribonuclease E